MGQGTPGAFAQIRGDDGIRIRKILYKMNHLRFQVSRAHIYLLKLTLSLMFFKTKTLMYCVHGVYLYFL